MIATLLAVFAGMITGAWVAGLLIVKEIKKLEQKYFNSKIN
jgi:hypothetical protein